MDLVEVDGLRIGYRQAGQGRPLVLVHGAVADSRDWQHQLEAFAGDFRLVAWDAPGCGGSDDLPAAYGFDDCVETLARFVRALGLDRPHVLGHSLGGMLAIAVHGRHPEIAGSLVLASAYAGWGGSLAPEEVERRVKLALRDSERPPEEAARDFVTTLFSPDAPAELVEHQVEMILEARPATTKAMLARFAPVDLRPVLPRIDVPTLLLYGDADIRAPASVAEALHAGIRGSVLVRLPGIGHCGHLEAPKQWNAEVLAFLRAQPA